MNLDITQVAQKLLDEMQLESDQLKARMEGVVLLHNRLKLELDKVNGATEQQDSQPGAETTSAE